MQIAPMSRPLLALFFLLIIPICTQAQSPQIGLAVGMTNYKGDVSPRLKMAHSGIGLGLFMHYNLSGHFVWRSNADVDLLRADYANIKDDRADKVNYSFQSTAISLSSGFEYLFFDFRKKYNPKFTPYLFGQIGMVLPQTRGDFNGSDTESNQVMVALPFGVGVKADVSRRITLALEWRTTKVFSDQLDGIYGQPEIPLPDANTATLDSFYRLHLAISFHSQKLLCPRNTPRDPTF